MSSMQLFEVVLDSIHVVKVRFIVALLRSVKLSPRAQNCFSSFIYADMNVILGVNSDCQKIR